VTPPELRALVADSLALWGVTGTAVSVTEDGVALVAPEGTPLRLRAAWLEERPLRWWLERPGQRRPCTSILGLLRGLRNAVGAGEEGDASRRLRVAPLPTEA
jgi:hypothetical protein